MTTLTSTAPMLTSTQADLLLSSSSYNCQPGSAAAAAANAMLSNNANGPKRYTLVKWLENSQFDVNNESLGRLTSIAHSNIIDYDPDELKAGMEISVFHNGGEIWRAQVIIPKTSHNTIDLPASYQKLNKIKTKASSTATNKSNDSDMLMETSISSSSSLDSNSEMRLSQAKTLCDLADFTSSLHEATSNATAGGQQSHIVSMNNSNKLNTTLMLLTSSNGTTSTSTPIVLTNPIGTATSVTANSGATNNNNNNNNSASMLSPSTISSHLDSSLSKMNKELQFLQTAINEAGLGDFNQTMNNGATQANNNNNNNNNNNQLHHQQQQQQSQTNVSTSELTDTSSTTTTTPNVTTVITTGATTTNIETVLQMQCALLDQQKELKAIEYETMEQLKLLHQNLNRLAKKFDSFETFMGNSKLNLTSPGANVANSANSSFGTAMSGNKGANNKNNTTNCFSKLNNSIQQIKIIDTDMNKDVFNSLIMCSPQQLNGISISQSDIGYAKPLEYLKPIELSSYLNTSQLLEPMATQTAIPLIALPINTSNLKILQTNGGKMTTNGGNNNLKPNEIYTIEQLSSTPITTATTITHQQQQQQPQPTGVKRLNLISQTTAEPASKKMRKQADNFKQNNPNSDSDANSTNNNSSNLNFLRKFQAFTRK